MKKKYQMVKSKCKRIRINEIKKVSASEKKGRENNKRKYLIPYKYMKKKIHKTE